MIFDWINYLTLAEQLNSDTANEAQLRTSISRSYYCVFHKARLLCLNDLKIIKTVELRGINSHKLVIDRLAEQSDEDLYEISHRLSSLKERREKADYEATADIRQTYVNDTILKAQMVLKMIREYNS